MPVDVTRVFFLDAIVSEKRGASPKNEATMRHTRQIEEYLI